MRCNRSRCGRGETLGHRANGAVVLGQPERPGRLLPFGHVALLVHQPGDHVQALGRPGAGELGLQPAGEIAVMVFEQPDRRLAAALVGHPLEQLRQRLLIGTREQALSVGTQPIREGGRADAALLATVGDQRLGFELLQVMADRVDGHAQLVGELFRRERLRTLQRKQDFRAKSFVRRELQRMDAHRKPNPK